jgi:hypothetical protein
MPKYSVAQNGNIFPKRWYVRRVGWLGNRLWSKFCPWLSGDELKLELVIESDIEGMFDFTWVLIRRLSNMTEEQVAHQFIENIRVKKRNKPIPLNTYLFQYEDEYRLFTELNPKAQVQLYPEPHRQTLINFEVLSRDVWYTDWEKDIGIGFIGAVIGALITILVGWIGSVL